MTQIIQIISKNENHQIEWGLSEHFQELKGQTFMLNEVSAEQIEKMSNISITAKILLSAVAGAVIQHLMDKDMQFDVIFNNGKFVI